MPVVPEPFLPEISLPSEPPPTKPEPVVPEPEAMPLPPVLEPAAARPEPPPPPAPEPAPVELARERVEAVPPIAGARPLAFEGALPAPRPRTIGALLRAALRVGET
jgi:hypothetical protein